MGTNPYPFEKPSKTNLPSGSSALPSTQTDARAASVFGNSGASQPAHAMDGSQFHNVIEEQTWAELPPTREEQMPRRARHLDEGESAQSPHQEQAQISVGPA
jgi:hypothetical protein